MKVSFLDLSVQVQSFRPEVDAPIDHVTQRNAFISARVA